MGLLKKTAAWIAHYKGLSPKQQAAEDLQYQLGRNPDGSLKLRSRSPEEERDLLALVERKTAELQERGATRRGELVAVNALNEDSRKKNAELQAAKARLASVPGLATANDLRGEIAGLRGEIHAFEKAQKLIAPLLSTLGISPEAVESAALPGPTKKDSAKPPPVIKARIVRVLPPADRKKNLA